MNVKRLHVLITGTTSGIGYGLLEHYDGMGVQVTAVNRRKVPEMESRFPQVNFVCVDVRQAADVAARVRTLWADGGLPDIFILNAGVNRVDQDPFFDLEAYQDVIQTNLFGVLHFVAPLTQLGPPKKKIRVVAISSMGGYLANPYCLSYHVSKRALSASFDVLSEMYAETNLRFKQVLLGPVPTAIHDTSAKFPKIMARIKSLFSISLPAAVQAIADFSGNNRKKIILPWKAYFLFQAIRFAQGWVPGFYRGRKTMDGLPRTQLKLVDGEGVHAKG